MGKSSAFEDCYNLLRKQADFLYVHENFGADEEISNIINIFNKDILTIKFLVNSEELINKKEDIQNILLMMESYIKTINIILKQVKS